MVRNANWWRAGKPYLDGLVFGIFKDPAAMVAQFEAGAQDVAYSPSLADGQRLQASGKYTGVFNAQQGAFFYISANTTKAPMDNKLFRQALQWAIDRERIASTTLHGLVGPGLNLPWPAYSPAYEAPKNQTYTFNLEKAAALVKQAGADGASFDITYNTTGFGDEYANMAQIIQADLAKIGVKTALKGLDGPTFNTQGLQLSYNGLRIAANAGAGAYDASTVFQGGGAFNFQSNFAGFKDPTYADLVMQAGTEPDTAKRKALYSKLNDYVLDQSFTYVLSASPSIIVTAPKVHALQFQQSGPLSYSEAWIQ
ncbi:MAG: ABC transporter substrate-binding protein [Chloroflexi bacterium]|nr:ABC transporter substrate-binding protein [Chloroflexota bacterium]